MIFRNIFSGFSCESKGDSSDEFYARSSSRVELLRFSDARSPENRHSGLGRRRNRGWNFYVDFLLVSLFLLYLYKTKKERLLVAGKAGSASGIRRDGGSMSAAPHEGSTSFVAEQSPRRTGTSQRHGRLHARLSMHRNVGWRSSRSFLLRARVSTGN